MEMALGGGRKRWWRRTPFKAGAVLVLLLLALAWMHPGEEGWIKGVRVMLRAVGVLAVWMLVIRPLGMALFRRFRRREEGLYGAEVTRALEEFPALRQAAGAAWRHSRGSGGFRRWKIFLVELIVRALAGVDREQGAESREQGASRRGMAASAM